jgi:glucokinase
VTHSPETHFLAIEIGGTKLQVCVGTADGTIKDRRRFSVEREGGAQAIRAHIETASRELVQQWNPAAIGVGYGGPVDWREGRIAKSYHIAGWSDFGLGEWLEELCGIPAFVENDANVAAFGEAHHGAGRGHNPVFYTTIGSGVGGGLVVDGAIYHGTHPGEVEFGHLRLDRQGTITEDVCSGWSLDRIIREAVAQRPESRLAELCETDPGNEARHLGLALAAGDALAGEILDTMTGHLAYALGFVVQLFHPGVIVLGGGVSLLGESLRGALERKLPAHIMDVYRPGPPIVLAALREDAVPIGALTLAARRFAL